MKFNKDFDGQATRGNEDYSCPDELDHARKNADMFVGSQSMQESEVIVIDLENSKETKPIIKRVIIKEADARKRIFLEALTNATDNAFNTIKLRNQDPKTRKPRTDGKLEKADIGIIEVEMTPNSIRITNGGLPMPIIVRDEESSKDNLVTIPKFLASKLRAGSNNEKENNSYSCGKNAVGLKTIGIMSDHCIIEVKDNIEGQTIKMEWKDRMATTFDDVIKPGFAWDNNKSKWITKANDSNHYSGPNSYSIYWKPTSSIEGWENYSLDNMGYYAKTLIDMSFVCKIPVVFKCKFGDKKYKLSNTSKDFLDYFNIIKPGGKPKNKLSHIIWHNASTSCTGNDTAKKYKNEPLFNQIEITKNPRTVDDFPMFEIFIYDTPKNGGVYSFVNGLETIENGIHVDPVIDNIKKAIKIPTKASGIRNINSIITTQIMSHYTIIISVRLKNAAFHSQTKTKLATYTPKTTPIGKISGVNIDMGSGFNDWYATKEVINHINSLKTVVKKVGDQKIVHCNNLVDATKAGSSESHKCTLYLVEGNTAKSYPATRIDNSEGGRLYGGYLPLKGKIRNVSKASTEEFEKSPVIDTIMMALGLNRQPGKGVGLDFTEEKNRAALRYGHIVIVTDADTDGYHILCLLINLFSRKYPTMIKSNMISYLRTPIIRIFEKAKKENQKPVFVKAVYEMKDFKKYMSTVSSNFCSSHNIVYYKGLGSSTPQDVKQDIIYAWDIITTEDENSQDTLDIAFGRHTSNCRKTWISDDCVNEKVTIKKIPRQPKNIYLRNISNILKNELITYYHDSIDRAIPSALDGWKGGQRQALWYVLQKWKYGHSRDGFDKVCQIANSAAGFTNYMHGEKSMTMTIINMAQCFIGGKNMNIFAQSGQFGTRNENGQDVSESTGRYCKSKSEWWFKYAFDETMIGCVKKRLVEGKEVEPLNIPSVIPWHVVNGVLGIASGYSTKIPPHSPFDVVKWLSSRCRGKDPNEINPILPFFCGHTGKLCVFNLNSNIDIDPNTELPAGNRNVEIMSSSEGTNEDGRDVIEDANDILYEEETDESDTLTSDVTSNSESSASSNDYRKTPKTKKAHMVSYGVYIRKEKNNGLLDIEITELPIGVCNDKYKSDVLKKWADEKIIKGFDDYGIHQNIRLRLYDFDEKKMPCNMKSLKLMTKYSLSNMNLSVVDASDPENPRYRAIKFNNVGEILEVYYRHMINMYKLLIAKNLANKENEKDKIEQKRLLILMFLDEELNIPTRQRPVKKSEWYIKTDDRGISRGIVDRLRMEELTDEKIEELDKLLTNIGREIYDIKNQKPNELYREDLLEFNNKVLLTIKKDDELLSIAHEAEKNQVQLGNDISQLRS